MANEEMIQTHVDNFLAKIAGETPIDDNPRNSTEFWLNEIAENGGGGGGTTVVANPTLAGTEDALTGLQVGDTKYKVTRLYKHSIHIEKSGYYVDIIIIEANSTPYTKDTIEARLIADSELIGTNYYYKYGGYLNPGGSVRYTDIFIRNDHIIGGWEPGTSGTIAGFDLTASGTTVTDTVE